MSVREITKKILKSNPVGRAVYKPLHKCWRLYNEPRRRRSLQKHGDETLQFLHKFFTENDIEYYIDWGTLLGVVRENGFIKHDDDIDITIRHSNISPKQLLSKFLEMGYSYVHAFHANGKIIEASIIKDRLSIDFFFANDNCSKEECYELYDCVYFPDVKYPKVNANTWRAWYFPKSVKAKEVDFHGYKINIPDDYEAILIREYGTTWHTPIKNFEYKQEELHFEDCEGYAYRETVFDSLPN